MFDNKCGSGLTRFDGKIHLIIQRIEGRVRQKGYPHILNCFSERSEGEARSKISIRLGHQFMSNGLYVQDQSFISLS